MKRFFKVFYIGINILVISCNIYTEEINPVITKEDLVKDITGDEKIEDLNPARVVGAVGIAGGASKLGEEAGKKAHSAFHPAIKDALGVGEEIAAEEIETLVAPGVVREASREAAEEVVQRAKTEALERLAPQVEELNSLTAKATAKKVIGEKVRKAGEDALSKAITNANKEAGTKWTSFLTNFDVDKLFESNIDDSLVKQLKELSPYLQNEMDDVIRFVSKEATKELIQGGLDYGPANKIATEKTGELVRVMLNNLGIDKADDEILKLVKEGAEEVFKTRADLIREFNMMTSSVDDASRVIARVGSSFGDEAIEAGNTIAAPPAEDLAGVASSLSNETIEVGGTTLVARPNLTSVASNLSDDIGETAVRTAASFTNEAVEAGTTVASNLTDDVLKALTNLTENQAAAFGSAAALVVASPFLYAILGDQIGGRSKIGFINNTSEPVELQNFVHRKDNSTEDFDHLNVPVEGVVVPPKKGVKIGSVSRGAGSSDQTYTFDIVLPKQLGKEEVEIDLFEGAVKVEHRPFESNINYSADADPNTPITPGSDIVWYSDNSKNVWHKKVDNRMYELSYVVATEGNDSVLFMLNEK